MVAFLIGWTDIILRRDTKDEHPGSRTPEEAQQETGRLRADLQNPGTEEGQIEDRPKSSGGRLGCTTESKRETEAPNRDAEPKVRRSRGRGAARIAERMQRGGGIQNPR